MLILEQVPLPVLSRGRLHVQVYPRRSLLPTDIYYDTLLCIIK